MPRAARLRHRAPQAGLRPAGVRLASHKLPSTPAAGFRAAFTPPESPRPPARPAPWPTPQELVPKSPANRHPPLAAFLGSWLLHNPRNRFPLRAADLKLARTRRGGEEAFGETADGFTGSEGPLLRCRRHKPPLPPPIWTRGRLQAQSWGLGMWAQEPTGRPVGRPEMPSPGKRKGMSRRQKQNCQQMNTKFPDQGHFPCSECPTGVLKSPAKEVTTRGRPFAVLITERAVHTGTKYAAGCPRPRIPPPTRAGAAGLQAG